MKENELLSLPLEKIRRAATQNSVSDAEFADLIYLALSELDVSEQNFRDAFGLSQETVHRWTTGKNLPQPQTRTAILRWVLQQKSL